jgi:hypothetical protein
MAAPEEVKKYYREEILKWKMWGDAIKSSQTPITSDLVLQCIKRDHEAGGKNYNCK